MLSQGLVSGLPRTFPSLPLSPAPPCSPCVAGRLRGTPHSSSLRPATAPFETLHLDVWGPAPTQGSGRERYFLVVVDDFSRYTMVFPLAKKSEVTATLIRWLLATEGTRGRRVSCLHSDRGGEFRSGILGGFCGEQGITQSWTLPESPQQNGVAEHRIGLVMDIARTSMIHARAPHFLWPYAVRYAAHQLNLQPRVSRPEASPTSLWTGSPGVGSAFRVWGCLALVRDTSADKLSARALPYVFLGFPVDSADWSFYHPPLHQFLDSRDVRFDESVSYYTRYPCRGLPVPPPPLFLAPSPPPAPAPPVPPPPPGPAPPPHSPLSSLRHFSDRFLWTQLVLELEVQPLAVLGLGVLGRGVLELEVLAQVALALGVLELEVLAQVALALGVLELEVLAQVALALGVLEMEVLALVVLALGVLGLEVLALEVLVLGVLELEVLALEVLVLGVLSCPPA
ncbi:unnamed protein product [Closterium sp. NIES-64]|nr:unnamed protein product [Closterium sp. NIES-64]